MNKKNFVSILGSTGSIGKQTLSIIKEQSDKFKVESLAAGKNISLLLKQVSEFKPKNISIEKKNEISIFKDDVLVKTEDNYEIKSQYGELN